MAQRGWMAGVTFIGSLLALSLSAYTFIQIKALNTHHIEQSIATVNEAHAGIQTQIARIQEAPSAPHPEKQYRRWLILQARDNLTLAQIEANEPSGIILYRMLVYRAQQQLQQARQPALEPLIDTLNHTLDSLQKRPQNQMHAIMQTIL
jgi:hypothetical protein